MSCCCVRSPSLQAWSFRVAAIQFNQLTASYAMGLQRRVSGTWSVQAGEFYDGHLTSVGFTSARVSVVPQWSIEPSVSVNAVTLPVGDFTTTVVRARSDYGFSPRMFARQPFCNTVRRTTPSAAIFVTGGVSSGQRTVCRGTDERDTLTSGYPGLRNRAFVVKINRLLQF